MPIRVQYPDPGWSTGKMRKVGDVRRGRPELEGPGIAEAEKLAGAGIAARGGTSPNVIPQQRAQLEAFGQQYQLGTIDWRTFHKEVKDRGWSFQTLEENLPGSERIEELKRRMEEEGMATLKAPDGSTHTLTLNGGKDEQQRR